MSKSLKERNQTQLITFVLANAIGLGILLQGLKEVLFLLDSVSKGNIAVIFRLAAIPAGLAVLIGILGWAVPRRWKETVIFWRTDKNCLPSSRAFNVIALNDPRIDRRRLAEKHGPLPTAPDQQTVLWYSLYRKNADNGAVEDAHCACLRYREMTALAVSIGGRQWNWAGRAKSGLLAECSNEVRPLHRTRKVRGSTDASEAP